MVEKSYPCQNSSSLDIDSKIYYFYYLSLFSTVTQKLFIQLLHKNYFSIVTQILYFFQLLHKHMPTIKYIICIMLQIDIRDLVDKSLLADSEGGRCLVVNPSSSSSPLSLIHVS